MVTLNCVVCEKVFEEEREFLDEIKKIVNDVKHCCSKECHQKFISQKKEEDKEEEEFWKDENFLSRCPKNKGGCSDCL
jgi:hypothetical protein